MKRIVVTLTLEVPDPVYPGFAWDHVQKAVEEYTEAHGWKVCAGSAREESLRVDRESETYEEFLTARAHPDYDHMADEYANEVPSRAMWETNQARSNRHA